MAKTQTNTSKLGAAVIICLYLCHLAAILEDFWWGGLINLYQSNIQKDILRRKND